jgi:hypothetical protein
MDLPEAPTSRVPIGDWHALLTLRGSGVKLAYLDPHGEAKAQLPAAFASAHKQAVAALKAQVKDIDRSSSEIRVRLETAFRKNRYWPADEWLARLAANPLSRVIAERLLWRVSEAGGDCWTGLGCADRLFTVDGARRAVPPTARVALWHPTMTGAEDAAHWREVLREAGIRQPFFQAWRPIYTPTPPERITRDYSNRFAALVLEQPVLVRVLRNRGWTIKSRMAFMDKEECVPARLAFPGFGVTAEFWGTGFGEIRETHEYGAPNFPFFATSQVRFYAADQVAHPARTAIPLEVVPPRVFSDALFDIDLVSGIAAAGWNPGWRDPGPDAKPPGPEKYGFAMAYSTDGDRQQPSQLALQRAELLGKVLPGLAIGDRCRVVGHRIEVRGKWHDYTIHCGNAAVRIVDANRHVCIVPAGSNRVDALGAAIPVLGDDLLAIVLSKATMLVDEDAITQADIVTQLRRG